MNPARAQLPAIGEQRPAAGSLSCLNPERTIYPGEISHEQLLSHTPPGWRVAMTALSELIRDWAAVAEVCGESRPRIVLWTRERYDRTGEIAYPWIEIDGVGGLDDFEFEKLTAHSELVRAMVKLCECCGTHGATRHEDSRGGGGWLMLCRPCFALYLAKQDYQLPDGVGEPRRPLDARESWSPDRDDRGWTPTKDREDDLRDGLLDDGFPL